jgi:hypothetical protein
MDRDRSDPLPSLEIIASSCVTSHDISEGGGGGAGEGKREGKKKKSIPVFKC